MEKIFSNAEFERLRNCFKIIPTAYDDSLSYYDQLSAVLSKIIEALQYIDQIQIVANAYTDEQIAILKADLLIAINELANQIKIVAAKEEEDVKDLHSQINDVINRLSETVQTIDGLVNSRIVQYDSYIKDYISSQLIDVKVINYFTGEKVSVQDMLDYLAQLHISTGLTYAALIARNYTYSEMISICASGNYSYSDIVREAATIFPVK